MNAKFDRRRLHRTVLEPHPDATEYPVYASSRSRLFTSISTIEYFVSTRIYPKPGSDNESLTQAPEANPLPLIRK